MLSCRTCIFCAHVGDKAGVCPHFAVPPPRRAACTHSFVGLTRAPSGPDTTRCGTPWSGPIRADGSPVSSAPVVCASHTAHPATVAPAGDSTGTMVSGRAPGHVTQGYVPGTVTSQHEAGDHLLPPPTRLGCVLGYPLGSTDCVHGTSHPFGCLHAVAWSTECSYGSNDVGGGFGIRPVNSARS